MGKHNFKSGDAQNAYFSMLSTIYSEINTVEQAGQFVEVNEENYEEVEKELKGYIDSGYILTGNGYPIKKGTEPYALFQKFFNGTEGVDYESKDKNFYFCLLGDKEQYYKMTVNNAGEPEVDNDPLKVEDIRRGVEPTQDELIAESGVLTEQVHKENAADRAKFGEFAKELREAAKSTSRDSVEYKDIIKLLDTFEQKVDFSNSKEPAKSEWQKLDKEQRLALPMVLLKEKIDKYLEHKAVDGIKQNTYYKLAAVEKLNQYIGKRIEQIKPKDFVFLDIPRKAGLIKQSPDAEYEATKKEWEKVHTRETLPNRSISDTQLKEALHYMGNKYQNEGKNKDLIDVNELANVNRCMNRIMLKVQTKFDGEKQEELRANVTKARDALLNNPLPSKKLIAEAERKAKQKAPTV